MDAGIPGGVPVGTAGLQLIAEGRLFQHDVNQDRHNDGDDDAAIYLAAGEQLIQPHLGGRHAVVGRLVDIPGLVALHYVLQVADIKEPGHQACRDPVGHDAGDDLVDIKGRLQQAGDSAPQGTGQHTAQEGDEPDEPGGNAAAGNGKRQEQGSCGTGQVLARRADIEQAGLKGHRHRNTGKDERRSPEQHVADIGGIEAEGQSTSGVTPGAQYAKEHQPDAVPRALQRDQRVKGAHD